MDTGSITKKVIDVGALSSPRLDSFLSASRRNFAILTEFAALEMFNGSNPVRTLRLSLPIVARFPKQVILLKSYEKILQLAPRAPGLQKRLEDQKKTLAFTKYCEAFFATNTSASALAQDIGNKNIVAARVMDRFTRNTESVRSGIAHLVTRFDGDDLKAIRKQQPASASFTQRVIQDIIELTSLHLRERVCLNPMPTYEDSLYSFTFRYAVCCYALSLKWVKDHGHATANPETLKNDYLDMTYAAYATFFDGLITNDGKLQEVFGYVRWMLKNLFQVL